MSDKSKFTWDNVNNINDALSKLDKILDKKIEAIDNLDFDTIEDCVKKEKEIREYINHETNGGDS